ncbi:hypothetical protein [Sediminibacillus albus]|uniref:hypothetical protein n=1 Tax=Sediminibacillus albus TaxID=407036 RepID=UPI0011135E6E|nr:hypothetical protein [Sediminibacillus albus]
MDHISIHFSPQFAFAFGVVQLRLPLPIGLPVTPSDKSTLIRYTPRVSFISCVPVHSIRQFPVAFAFGVTF